MAQFKERKLKSKCLCIKRIWDFTHSAGMETGKIYLFDLSDIPTRRILYFTKVIDNIIDYSFIIIYNNVGNLIIYIVSEHVSLGGKSEQKSIVHKDCDSRNFGYSDNYLFLF